MDGHSFSSVLQEYCHIVGTIPKWERKKRHQALQQWLAADCVLPSYAELMAFLAWADEQEDLPLNKIFEQKVVYPVFDKEIFVKHNAQAMKQMALRFDGTAFQVYKQEYSVNILTLALACLPDDKELLNLQWQQQMSYYAYTIHEVPWGVLWDNNGARLEHMDELEAGLEELEALHKRLGNGPAPLVAACRDCYALWRLYLVDRSGPGQYRDFLDCIRQNQHLLSEEAIHYVWGEGGLDLSD